MGMRKKGRVSEILEQLKSTPYGGGLEAENEELLGMKSKGPVLAQISECIVVSISQCGEYRREYRYAVAILFC